MAASCPDYWHHLHRGRVMYCVDMFFLTWPPLLPAGEGGSCPPWEPSRGGKSSCSKRGWHVEGRDEGEEGREGEGQG